VGAGGAGDDGGSTGLFHHWRYAHITELRADAVNAPLLGMKKVVSEDAVRRALSKIDEAAGIGWLREQLEYCVRPLLSEPWILDVDTTVRPLYGHQQAAEVGYNPSKRGRPSQVYHSYLMAELRLVLEVEVASGKQHTAKHAAPGLWALLDRLRAACAPALLRGDTDWGNEAVMCEAERRGNPICSSCACAAGSSGCWSGQCGRVIGSMPAPAGRASGARFDWSAGAGSAVSLCCAGACAKSCSPSAPPPIPRPPKKPR
jgi:hypothetical protein